MNPMEMIKQMVMNKIGKNMNPMQQNLINMANKGDVKGVETFARNLLKEQGRNYDEEFNKFKSQLNIK